jgi:hypothetical protein
MGNVAKALPRREPPGVLYWVSRALLCVLIAPVLGTLIGIVGVVAGLWMGELAALAVLVLFLVDIFVRLVRARRLATSELRLSDSIGDPDIEAWD